MIDSSYQVKTLTWIKSYIYLWVHTQKGLSSWGTVWSGSYRSRASITVPDGRSGKLLRIFGRLVIL